MVRNNDDATDFESWSTDRLTEFINENAPVAAGLDDDYADLRDEMQAEVEAAVAELKARNTPTTIEDLTDDDHYLRHVTETSTEFSGRHDRAVRTEVVDDTVVHRVFEAASTEADDESLSWSRVYYGSCPACGDDVDEDADDGAQYVETWSCESCAWEVRRASTDYKARPLWSKTTYPHDFDDEPDVDFEKVVDGFEDEDEPRTRAANLMRDLWLGVKANAVGTIKDAAYVSAEYEDEEKVEDAYVDTFECGKCGDHRDAPAKKSHPVFGDVCPACEDVEVWSVEDADLPEDVVDRMNDHKSFNKSTITDVLRDVLFYGNFVATVDDHRDDGGMFAIDTDDVEPEDVPAIKTGEQGRHGTGRGDGKAGTGFRRPGGAAHNRRYWRTFVRDAWETGLIERADDGDVDFDAPGARWSATEKGREVFDAIARCETCGDAYKPYLRISRYKVGRSYKTDYKLTTACPTCDAKNSEPVGAMVIESSSSEWSLIELEGVAYE